MADVLHPQTLLTYGMNGSNLPVPHGAPVRLRVERQLGYKHLKYLSTITVTDSAAEWGKGKRDPRGRRTVLVVCGNLNRKGMLPEGQVRSERNRGICRLSLIICHFHLWKGNISSFVELREQSQWGNQKTFPFHK
jgi:DMSO/TMAO reductase YedYZ molybdopterin-dependent catalytic subunit